jgi:hypothetical protein
MSLSFCVQKIEDADLGFGFGEFSRFRHRIAQSIGLKDVYAGTDTDMYETKRYIEIGETHPIYPLIEHSDCNGDMEPEECGQVGNYLKALIPLWEKEMELGTSDELLENDIQKGKALVELMLKCYKNDETLLFV